MRSWRKEEGFTLIELMVVVVIIGVLIALLLPNMTKQADRAKEKRAVAELTLMKAAIDAYYSENGVYPKDTNDSATGEIKYVLESNGIKWEQMKDPWGHSYVYDTDDAYSKYVIYSPGPDSASGKDFIVAKNNVDKPEANQTDPTGTPEGTN